MTSFYPLPLSKLYKVLVRIEEPDQRSVSELLGVSKQTAKKYVKTSTWLKERLKGVSTLEDLQKSLREVMFNDYRVKDAINLLYREMIPLTPQSLKEALASLGVKVSITEARAFIEWLKQMDVIRERRVPLVTEDLESRVLELIREKGSLTYSSLVKRYGEGVRDILFKLWSQGKVRVPVLDRYRRELSGAEDLDKLPADLKGKVFSKWHDRISGKTYSQLIIPERAKVEARWEFVS